MKTRSKPIANPRDMQTSEEDIHVVEPPKLLILPKVLGPEARIVSLAHPRTSLPSRYYFCPDSGIYEFTQIATPKSSHGSWLLSPASQNFGFEVGENGAGRSGHAGNEDSDRAEENTIIDISKGYVSQTAEIFTVTPIDPTFLLLPVLNSKTESKPLFLSSDDLFENLSASSKHFNYLIKHTKTKLLLEQKLENVCDSVEAGDEKMFRLNNDKLLQLLIAKAKRMVTGGLPETMEERFVRKVLEPPEMGVLRDDNTPAQPGDSTPHQGLKPDLLNQETEDSQSSVSSTITANSHNSVDTNITVPDHSSSRLASQDIIDLLRLRTAISYMLKSYVPSNLACTLDRMLLASTSPINFTVLDQHLSYLNGLRTKVLASRSIGDYSHKRSMYEDDDVDSTRAGKKKKKKEEEEKRKKAGESRGVKNLKKVDTAGMKKMSDFFGKASATKKAKS